MGVYMLGLSFCYAQGQERSAIPLPIVLICAAVMTLGTMLGGARIIKKVGFEPLKLETDEPVEDGSILWFAVRKATYITYQEAFDYV
jgi:phosphate/sulfate permease